MPDQVKTRFKIVSAYISDTVVNRYMSMVYARIDYSEIVIDGRFALATSRHNLADDLLELCSIMRIRLTRKFALALNGVDLSKFSVGDEVDLPERSAMLLVLEGWAERVEPSESLTSHATFQSVRAD